MTRYRKKPVVIEAWAISFDADRPAWVEAAFDREDLDWCPAGDGLYINTLEGHMLGGMGDMLIKGVKGELYACKAEIFDATYEPFDTVPPAWARFILRLSRILVNWWVWTARPFMLHPIRSIKQLFERVPVTEDDLEHLTPQERKALK